MKYIQLQEKIDNKLGEEQCQSAEGKDKSEELSKHFEGCIERLLGVGVKARSFI